MAQIEDVARAAGVSTATVSRALRGLPHVSQATSERVRKVAAELGYVASPSAVSLASGRTRTIGLLTPRVNQWFFSNVIDGAERALRAEDFDALLYTFEIARGRKRRRVNPDVLRRRVDGILVVGLPLEKEEVEALLALGYPLIFVGAGVPGQVTVRLDDERTAYEATRHLLALGHRQIGHITGAPGDSAPWTPPVDRRLGWIRAMTEAGLEASPDLEVNGHFDLEGGRDSTRLLLARRPDVTAIFAASDEMAMGAMMTARELGLRIPEDLSVIGIDGHDLGELVGLTTMAQSAQDQGTAAATLLLGLITGTPAPEQVIFPTELVVRTSTAPPRRHGRAGSPPGAGGGAVTKS